jgi:hypothetical protein
MPITDREKINAEMELVWAEILGAVRDRCIGVIYRKLNRLRALIKERDIT